MKYSINQVMSILTGFNLVSDFNDTYKITSGIIGEEMFTHWLVPAGNICANVIRQQLGFSYCDNLVKEFIKACVYEVEKGEKYERKADMKKYKKWVEETIGDNEKEFDISSLNEEDKQKSMMQIMEYTKDLFKRSLQGEKGYSS